MKTKSILLSALIVLVFGYSTLVSAQTINGNIVGNVVDQQGAVIAGATVTAINAETGAQRTATANEEGRFSINALPIGVYNVRVEAASFGVSTTENVQVNTSENTEINVSLTPGSVAATVEITATGELLDATQSQVSKVVDQQKILELPGRNTLNGLALLNPGVLPNQNARPGSGFAVNGNRTRSNNFTIDGANNNDQNLSIPRQNLPPEAIQQFQIVTNTFAAEYGRNAGSYVNQITRSGTNDFSGAIFYNNNSNGLNALTVGQERAFRANVAAGIDEKIALRRARSVVVDNTYGFTFGGPIVKNHTFFFTSLDFQDIRQTVGATTRPALGATGRAQLTAIRNANNATAIDFLLNTFPAANDPTIQGLATVTGITGGLELATYNPTQGSGIPYGTDFNRFLAKINTRINSKDNLSFRYLVDTFNDPGAPASLPGLAIGQANRNDSFTINDVYAITQNLINESRFTYSYRRLGFPNELENFVNGSQLVIGGVSGAFNGGNANFPQGRNDNVYELTDNVSYTTGDHNLKFGYNMLRYTLNSTFAPNSRGFIQYDSLTDFLNDRASLIQLANGTFDVNAVTYEHSFFAQDDWRFNNDLTLNLGLRYEYVTTPFGFFSNAKSDINNFAPRIGFAYNPKNFLEGKLVLRGGVGIAYDQVFQNILTNNSRNYPRAVNNSVSNFCTGCAPYLGFNNIPLTATAPGLTAPGAVRAFFARSPENVPASAAPLIDVRLFSPNERIRQPQSTQWTASLQYQLANDVVFKAEYIGTRGSNLVREVETNYSFSNPTLAASINRAPNERLDPTRGSVLVGQGIANSIYHAGQFTLERRLSDLNVFGTNFGQFTFNANYTYSSFISESDDVLGGQANRTIPADPRDPQLDRARSGFDQPHRFVFSGVLASPEVFKGNGFLNRLFSGYQISTVTTAATGIPFSVLNAANALGIGASQIQTVTNSQRVGLGNPNGVANSFTTAIVTNGVVTIPDPNAKYIIYPANSGILGGLGANTERTPSTFNTDLALVKNIRTFGERQRLQLRAEVFNLFNRRNYTLIPNNTLSPGSANSNFLQYGLTNPLNARAFNFGARYFF